MSMTGKDNLLKGSDSRRRAFLMLTTALVAASSSTVQAATVTVAAPVAPATSTTVGTVNGQIATAINAPDSDLTVTIDSGAVIVPGGGSNINLFPSTGAGDGKIILSNAGKVGTVDATGAVTATAGVQFFGAGAAAGGNTFTGTNSGLVTGGLVASGFGGAVSVENSGTVFGGINATGFSDVAVANAAGGVVNGAVTVSAGGDVTIRNDGIVLGITQAQSTGNANKVSGSNKTEATTVPGTGGAADVTTTVVANSSRTESASTGGSVTGTYAFVNGDASNLGGGASGNVFQTANKASTATVSGSLVGNLVSQASGTSSVVTTAYDSINVTDTTGNGSNKVTDAYSSVGSSTPGGVSTVTVSGLVQGLGSGATASVSSFGTESSAVAIDGGRVKGSVLSSAGGSTTSFSQTATTEQTITAGVAVNDAHTSTYKFSSTPTDGTASVSLLNGAQVDGAVSASGVKAASVTVGNAATVGSSVSASASGSSTAFGLDNSYTRDAKTGVVTQTTGVTSASTAVGGDATATVAAKVTGTVSAASNAGNATVAFTGGATGSLIANANGASTTSSTTKSYSDKASPSSTAFNPTLLVVTTQTKSDSSSTSTATGGKASVMVDTAAYQVANTTPTNVPAGVTGSVVATGLGGATIAVTKGSTVGGSLIAGSQSTNTVSSFTGTFTDGSQTGFNSQSNTTNVGGAASVTNAGTVGSVVAQGVTGATITNSGTVNGGVSATSLFANSNASIVETNSNVVASRLRTTTTAQSLVGGKAEVVNDAGGVVKGDVTVLGATGSVTNAGVIAGAIKLGSSNATLANGTLVQQQSVSADTGGVFTASTTPFAQSYTVNQNGVSRGISVLAAQITNPDQTKQLASNVTATINLNNGSATLGSIEGARDATTGAFLTDTTLNLDGNGFLGVDRALTAAQVVAGATPTRNPQLVLSKDATDAGFTTSATTVRITGVNTVNKTGSGTFVITGTAYTPATASVPAQYTLDVGSLNVKAGELQLGLDPSVADAKFGIKGAITVSDGATLLLGRRVPVSTATPVSSLTGAGETILATNVVLAGDYNQTAGGKTIAVITPSLVRASVAVTPSSSTTEILGPVAGTVNVGFFTTPAVLNGGTPAANSRVDVTGNVNLAGQVVLNLSRDSLFATGDNSTLFTYTGTADVSKATVAPSLTSRFVSFALVNDAATKTIGLTTTRNSYATGATNPNAAAAAAGLDSALTAAAGAIKADAAGAVVFPTVQAYGMAQDVANISAGLDWRLSAAAAAQVFDELSSAEFYGSLSNIRQNAAFTSAAERLTQPRATDLPVGASLWVSPSGTFSKFDASGSGASSVRVDSYGGAAGVDLSYGNGGAMGFGMAYGQHDADGRGRTEHARVRTTTLGAYWTHNFGNLYANAQFSYGFSEFDTRRTLSLLARTITANYRGSEWDGRVQVGYKVEAGDLILTPFGELALRHWSTRDYNEQGGAGIGLAVSRASKSVFNPTIGGKIAYDMEIGDSFHLRPYGKLSYTFQGNAGVDRTVRYLAGGNSFVLNGVDPKGFGTIEGGLDAALNDKLGVFFGGGYSFAGSQKFGRIQSGLNINF